MAAKTKGSAGPSQLDALLSKNFGKKTTDLAKAIARMARIMCTEKCSTENGRNMEAFVACKLVPLSKNPGVRPIGIDELLRRIVSKAVTTVLKHEIQASAGNLQLCAG